MSRHSGEYSLPFRGSRPLYSPDVEIKRGSPARKNSAVLNSFQIEFWCRGSRQPYSSGPSAVVADDEFAGVNLRIRSSFVSLRSDSRKARGVLHTRFAVTEPIMND